MKLIAQGRVGGPPPFIPFFALVLFLVGGSGQGSAGSLSTNDHHLSKEGWVQARPGYSYAFPRDHGSHEGYSLEWWYVTGNLRTESGRRFGYELTFFRKGIQPNKAPASGSRWAIRHLYFAHLALTDKNSESFHYSEKLSRAGLGKAGALSDRMEIWIDQWSLKPVDSDHRQLLIAAEDEKIGLDLRLTLQKPPVIHGREGISLKGGDEGQASHYYSLTRLATEGTVRVGPNVFRVAGISWMDHEFGSGQLGDDQVGWDWFGLQFDAGMELMVYRLRKKNGLTDRASSGTFIFADGQSQHLSYEEFDVQPLAYWTSPQSKARYPAEWKLQVPSLHLVLHIMPIVSDQELRTKKSTQVSYWEGAVDVTGQFKGREIAGEGYVELTGYAHLLSLGE